MIKFKYFILFFFCASCAPKNHPLEKDSNTELAKPYSVIKTFSSATYKNENEAKLLLNQIVTNDGYEAEKASALINCQQNTLHSDRVKSLCWVFLGFVNFDEINIQLKENIINTALSEVGANAKLAAYYFLIKKAQLLPESKLNAFIDQVLNSGIVSEAKLYFLNSISKSNFIKKYSEDNKTNINKFLENAKSNSPHYMGLHALIVQKTQPNNMPQVLNRYCPTEYEIVPFMCWRFLKVANDFGLNLFQTESLASNNHFIDYKKNDYWEYFKEIEPNVSEALERTKNL